MPGKLPRLSRRPSGRHRTPRRECAPGRGRDPEAAASLQRTLLASVLQWLCRSHSFSLLSLIFVARCFDIREPRRSCRGAFNELAVREANWYSTKSVCGSEVVGISVNCCELGCQCFHSVAMTSTFFSSCSNSRRRLRTTHVVRRPRSSTSSQLSNVANRPQLCHYVGVAPCACPPALPSGAGRPGTGASQTGTVRSYP